jgi:hypothetical protein
MEMVEPGEAPKGIRVHDECGKPQRIIGYLQDISRNLGFRVETS